MGTRLNLDACPMTPKAHQVVAIQKLFMEDFVFLTDEMGMMKSASVISSASALCVAGKINRVIVVAPAQVKAVWFDEEIGELAKHCWPSISNTVTHYHRRCHQWEIGQNTKGNALDWIVTNYEYIRQDFKPRSRTIPPILERLLKQCTPQTLLVLDESSAVKNSTAYQTRASMWLRKRCGRVVLLTGTPIAHSPVDLLSQANLLHPSILSDVPGEYCNIWQFKARYCRMGGFQAKKIIAYHHLEDLQARLKPHTLRRLKKDCLDLPAKLDPVTLTVPLSSRSWTLYKKMRDHAIVELSGELSIARQAVTKLIRLSQLTSGFLGGLSGDHLQETGTEKIQMLITWIEDRLSDDPNFKLVVWSQFRRDVAQVCHALTALPVEVGRLWGDSHAQERDHALRLLNPTTAPAHAAIVVGTPQTGAFGISLASASTVVYLTNAYSLHIRLQSEDRTHRPGQTKAVSYFDIVATGPDGQQTIDHLVLKSLRKKQDLAEWTASAWLDALTKQRTDYRDVRRAP